MHYGDSSLHGQLSVLWRNHPLAPYNADLHYQLTGSSFEARHAKCHGLGFYSVDDLRRPDIEHVPGLVPNLGFAEQILTR